jgi:hypothetical protein
MKKNCFLSKIKFKILVINILKKMDFVQGKQGVFFKGRLNNVAKTKKEDEK